MTIAHFRAPSLAQIDAMAQAAVEGLPTLFRDHLKTVLLRVEDFPDDRVMDEMELESPYDILGLYWGHPVGMKGVEASGTLPDTIFLYRRPILDAWAEGEDSLAELVTHVLIHEVGHHFGLSDDDIDAIEADED